MRRDPSLLRCGWGPGYVPLGVVTLCLRLEPAYAPDERLHDGAGDRRLVVDQSGEAILG
jgi:hypothetical protein